MRALLRPIKRFFVNWQFDSRTYWKNRYAQGENSGLGSYGELAEFKAEIINPFVAEHQIKSVIEYGCGDGNQLRFLVLPSYHGFDVSPMAIQLCQKLYKNDQTKSFKVIDAYQGETAQLTLSLDVIYHVVEDKLYHAYMQRLFASAEAYVIIYSSNTDENLPNRAPHVKHRCFTEWITTHCPQWQLLRHIPNRYPQLSSADFYIFAKSGAGQ